MQIKLYPNLVSAVVDILSEIIQNGAFADKAIERAFKNNKRWGARDRNFIASSTYGVIRYMRLMEFLCESVPEEEKIAGLFKAYWWWTTKEISKTPELPNISESIFQSRLYKAKSIPAVLHSFPDWMVDQLKGDYPEDYTKILETLNRESQVVLRANSLKTDKAPLLKQLTAEGIQLSAMPDSDALLLSQRANVFRTEVFKKGWFEVQDRASQEVAPFLQVGPGMQVVDACAGAGGKSLHLAALMGGKGRIISMDTEAYKLAELKKRAKRAGAGNIEPRLIESNKTIKRLRDKADRLLLDVPCSGSGVIRRNPDSKWKIDEAFLDEITSTQAHILEIYSQMVKPGGKMVYATCSLFSRENEQQVALFLATHPEFKLEEERHLLPHEFGFDGFYMARMVRQKESISPLPVTDEIVDNS